MFRKLTRVVRPLLDLSERRALVAANDPGTDPDIVLTGARHLARMRNFRSAAALLDGIDTDGLDLLDECFVGVTLLSGQ